MGENVSGFEIRNAPETIRRAAATVSAKYPRLASMNTIITTGTGKYPVEAFPADERDNPFFGEKRPTIKFNTNKTTDFATPEELIITEHLHFFNKSDPAFSKLKNDFIKSYNEDQQPALYKAYERAKIKHGETRPFKEWLDISFIDQA